MFYTCSSTALLVGTCATSKNVAATVYNLPATSNAFAGPRWPMNISCGSYFSLICRNFLNALSVMTYCGCQSAGRCFMLRAKTTHLRDPMILIKVGHILSAGYWLRTFIDVIHPLLHYLILCRVVPTGHCGNVVLLRERHGLVLLVREIIRDV